MIHERASLRQRHIMQDMTTRIVPIEPQWFMQKAEVQSRTWRELNQGHIPQDIVDAITPAFALKLTRGHAADPNQVVLITLADDRVVGFAGRTTPSVSDNGMAACSFRILRHLGLGGLSLDVLVHNLRGQPLRFRRIRRDSRIEQPPPLLGIGEHGILRLPQSAFANP